MELGFQIFDIDGNKLEREIVINSSCFYFYSFMEFSVEVLNNDKVKIYSVLNDNGNLSITSGTSQNGNFGYTIYVPKDIISVDLVLFYSQNEKKITLHQLQEPKVSKITPQSNHTTPQITPNSAPTSSNPLSQKIPLYSDLLTNFDLPSSDELNSAIPEEFPKNNVIQRALLDFKHILKYKGTKQSITKFFDFLGYNFPNLFVKDLYLTLTGDYTTNPDKTINPKSGDYSVLYENFISTLLDSDNMPIAITNIQNLVSFEKTLISAIALANRYFTSPEQEIIEFNLGFASNIKNYDSMTSDVNMIFENDVINCRKNIEFECFVNEEVFSENGLVSIPVQYIKKRKQYKNVLLLTERKYTVLPDNQFNNIFFVDEEFGDSDAISITPDLIQSSICSILHFNIIPKNEQYIEIEFFEKTQPAEKLTIEKQLYSDTFSFKIGVTEFAEYRIVIKCFDLHNNSFEYYYDFVSTVNKNKFDMEIFTSGKIVENNITSDVDAPSKISYPVNIQNFVLFENLIPNNLKEYYNFVDISTLTNWLTDNNRHMCQDFNFNFPINKTTETIPLYCLNNWLEVLSFPYLDGYDLKFRVDNTIMELSEIKNDFKELDTIFATLLDIYENQDLPTSEIFNREFLIENDNTSVFEITEFALKPYSTIVIKNGNILFQTEYTLNSPANGSIEILDLFDGDNIQVIYSYPENTNPYYFICATECGIELTKEIHDFVLVSKTDSFDIISIYDNCIKNKIPVNYDFPLFQIGSEAIDWPGYTSEVENTITINNQVLPLVRSIYPKLIDLNSSESDGCEKLELGDIFVIRLNENFVVDFESIQWSLYNEFTKELLITSTDYMLKYRINENTVYSVDVSFKVNGEIINLKKTGIISSYYSENF